MTGRPFGFEPFWFVKHWSYAMKSSKPSSILTSFDELKVLLEDNSFPRRSTPVDPAPRPSEPGPVPVENEQQLFENAMSDVTPIVRDNCREKNRAPSVPSSPRSDNESEIMAKLSDLIEKGEGFVVADTPEYIEGTGYKAHPALAERLHNGGFAVEAHIDLHGFTVSDAKEAFEEFMSEAVKRGRRVVLIIHGRGLCSPKGPVIKEKVEEWLTRGNWRKWLLAYASARACEGGTGATYVLLRRYPATRRVRKRK
jgi:DNA-nicking Smr family endonuclease